jgi:hypothetical protein
VSKGGKDIRLYPNGRYRVRVYRFGKRTALGFYPSYEEADRVRDKFLSDLQNDPSLLMDDINPTPYSPLWFELQSRKQRIDFANRYRQ